MKFLDANIILRYLTNDIPSEASECERLFRDAAEGKEILFTNALVTAEVIWVLSSEYHFNKSKIIEGIRKIINTPNIHLDEKDILFSALEMFEMFDLDFIDSYNTAVMTNKGIKSVYSYDKHYDQIREVKRIEP